MKISVVINTGNSGGTLKRTLESVKWAQDIVVVDMQSTDDTLEIAKKYTDNIHTFESEVKYVEPARNFAIDKAKNEWVLIIDADEEVSIGLKDKLPELISGDVDVWDIPRKNIIFDKWVQSASWWPDYNRRLFRKGHLIWSDKIHSVPKVKGSIGKVDPTERLAIIHHNYQSIEQYIERLNKYTSIEADQKKGNHTSAAKTLIEGFAEFQKQFYLNEGHKENFHGVSLSILQMFYQSVVQLKIWQSQGFEDIGESFDKTISQITKELKYWQMFYLYKTTKNPIKKLFLKIRMKFKI